MTRDPVAWTMVGEGWDVVDPGGESVGRVKEVVGDPNADIFDGLVITRGLLRKDHYLPSERVTAIYEGRVEIDLGEREVEGLGESARTAGR